MRHTPPESSGSALVPYRADIDGLRGIAVLGVVLYHLGIGPGGGGFVGVDIFFVISGFLITTIVQAEIESGRFTFHSFYERRIRRLFPALFAVLLTTTFAGIWLLLPSDLALLGKSATATLVFASNIFFWRNSGYFDNPSEINPLLHTWSLAVEEQFYIGLPILLLLTHRHWRKHLTLTLSLAAGASLVACVVVQPLRPSAVFYLSPFRAWELLAGALLAVGAIPTIRNRLHRELAAVAGMALVAAGIIYIRPGVDFPGWHAIAPVLGTAALIHVGTCGGSIASCLLRFQPLVKIGVISYSLYLWHWPLIAFATYRNGLEPLDEWRWTILAASLLAAALSYRFIEKPFRRRKNHVTPCHPFVQAAVAGSLLAASSAMVVAGDGWPARFTGDIVTLDKQRHPKIPFVECDGNTSGLNGTHAACVLGTKKTKPSILIWGDSHAIAWAPAFDELLRNHGISGILAVSMACPPLVGVNSSNNADCFGNNRQVLEFLQRPEAPRTVVMVASWLDYTGPSSWLVAKAGASPSAHQLDFSDFLLKTVQQLQDSDRTVWIIGPTPGAPSAAPLRCAIAKMYGGHLPIAVSSRMFQSNSASFYAAASALRERANVLVTDPAPWFCDADDCAFMNQGFLLYRDGGHLNERGASYLEPFLASVLATALEPRSTRKLNQDDTSNLTVP